MGAFVPVHVVYAQLHEGGSRQLQFLTGLEALRELCFA
jgi:hypothetical protein